LLVEDNPGDARLVKELFRESTAPRFDVIHAANLNEAFELLVDSTLEAVLLDLNLPESQRLATLAEVRLQTALPIVVLTGLDDETLGYEAIRAGAQDYLIKGRVDSHTLVRSVRYAIERKSEEEALRESEEKYRTLFEGASEGILVADIESRKFKYANPAICKMLGYTEEELMQLGVADIHPKESLDHVMAEFEAQARGEKALASNLPCLRKDGSVVYVDVTSTPMVIDNRACNVGFFTDITERKQAEQALRGSEDRYRTLFEKSVMGITVVDMETGRFKYANPSICQMLGYTEEEFQHMRVEDIHTAEGMKQIQGEFAAAATGKKTSSANVPCLCKDSTVIYAGISGTSMVIDGRQCNVGFFIDVTTRKQAEEALKASEEKYRTLFESSRDAIMTLAPPSWRFTTGNPAMIKMFGARDKTDFVSHAPWDYSPEKQPDGRPSMEKALEMIETAMATGSHYFEWTHQRLGGDTFPATVLLTRVEISGQALLQATVHDITEIKRAEEEREKLEEQFRQAQKMEAVGRLAGGVAHDFNNLLTIISGYCEIVIGRIGEQDPNWKSVSAIKHAGERAAQLTRQLLAFGRKQVLQLRVINLNMVVEESKKMLGRIVGENIELYTALEPDLKPVLADPGQVEQVIMNLVVNSRDAMPDGGRITIETANAELNQESAGKQAGLEPGHYVTLAVSDTGCGMSSEVKEHLFEPFFTTKEQGKGTGLGLSTVYGIVKQSNGNIIVDSEPGRGTTFMIYLPVAQNVEVKLPDIPQEFTAPAKVAETILVVEDESDVRELILDVLKNAGYVVLAADSGEKAEKVCAEHRGPIHLLLADMMLPRMGGMEVARRLAQQRPECKVLYMSGYTDGITRGGSNMEHGEAFIGKPFVPDALLRKVRQVLGSGV
jgi:PAS domain S-box-containing protein